ncbi:hypothetical protein VPHK406_0234 [Vibrio phage K406]
MVNWSYQFLICLRPTVFTLFLVEHICKGIL